MYLETVEKIKQVKVFPHRTTHMMIHACAQAQRRMHFFPQHQQQVLTYHVLTFLVVTQQRQKLLLRSGPSPWPQLRAWGGPQQLLLGLGQGQQLGGGQHLCRREAVDADEASKLLLDDDGGGGGGDDVDVGGCEGLGSS